MFVCLLKSMFALYSLKTYRYLATINCFKIAVACGFCSVVSSGTVFVLVKHFQLPLQCMYVRKGITNINSSFGCESTVMVVLYVKHTSIYLYLLTI